MQLFIEIVHIFRCAINSLISIPWRKINSEFNAILFTCLRQLTDNIPFPIFIRSIPNTIFSQSRRPQAKTVMMFGCKNYPFHTGSNKSLHPLFAIQLRRIKCFRIRITISPLTVIKSIQTEMHKSVCFHLLPFHLFGFGYRKNRFGSFYNRLTSTKQAQGCTNTKKISVFFHKIIN